MDASSILDFDAREWSAGNGALFDDINGYSYDDDDDGGGGDDVTLLYSVPVVPQLSDKNEKRVGYDPTMFTFYEGPKKCDCCTNWVEKKPTQMPEVAKDKYDRAAILVFKGKNHKSAKATVGGLVALEDSFVEIQSEIIARLIRPALAKLGCLAPKSKNIQVKSPFRELFHSYPEIVKLRDGYGIRTEQYAHLNILVDLMDELFVDFSGEIRELHAKKMISCQHLWTIFPKGMIVYARHDSHDRLFQVENVEAERYYKSEEVAFWRIRCRYVQFDGVRFGWTEQKFFVDGFDGVRHISSLPVYPLGFNTDKGLEQRIRAQGRKMLEHQGLSHHEYTGRGVSRLQGSFEADDDDDLDEDFRRLRSRPIESVNATGRVIVDTYGFKKYNPGRVSKTKTMTSHSFDDDGNEIQEQPDIDPSGRSRFEAEAKGRLSSAEQALNKVFINKTPEYLLLISPMLPCFSLKKNEWLWLHVDGLSPIKWNSTAFDMLVIPEKRKSLLLTFIRHHNYINQVNSDVMANKGQGLVIMLSGPPGTGKTLTAEAGKIIDGTDVANEIDVEDFAVAERAQKPLFRLQAENMGLNAGQFSQSLAENLDLSTEWNTVLLLDEADAFLGKRSLENPSRNDLVSVLLRQLEYYRGIIILTTNLVEHIDDAFRSRIHFHLVYPALSDDARRKIWTGFLKRVESHCETANQLAGTGTTGNGTRSKTVKYNVQPSDIEALARWKLNGREIKTVVKTVYLWCRYNTLEFSLARLEDGIELTAPLSIKPSNDSGGSEPPQKRPRVE